jgi:hypothetical protein
MYEADTISARTLARAFVRLVTVGLVVALLVGGSAVALSAVSPSSLGFAFHGQLVDQSPSPTLSPGAIAAYTMRYRNTGLAPWQRGTDRQVTLGVSGDSPKHAESGIAVGWLSTTRVAATTEDLVLPGMIGTFTFNVRAPATSGIYRVPLRPVIDGLTWLDDVPAVLALTSDLGFHSQLVGQSDHPTLKPGQTRQVTITLRNTGARTWVRGAANQQVNLGIPGDDKSSVSLGVGWPSANRVATHFEATVPPGGIATFTFTVRAPPTPGVYPLHLQAVADGVTWLDDNGLISLITVLGLTDSADKFQIPVQANPGSPSFTSTSSVDPLTATAGSAVNIKASFTSATATSAIVGVEVFAPGATTLAYQKWFDNESFAAGEKRDYTVTWPVPAAATPGGYTVNLRVFSPGWKTLLGAKQSAAQFTVSVPAAATLGPTTTATAAPGAGAAVTAPAQTTIPSAPKPRLNTNTTTGSPTVIAGGSISITTSVTSATAAAALVDVEVFSPGATSPIYQVWYDNQSFAAGETRAYPATWQVPVGMPIGTYRVSVGVYAPGWATRYSWTDTAATFSVVSSPPSPTATAVVTAPPAATTTPTPTVLPTVAPTATPAATNPVAPTPLPYPGDPTGYFDAPAANASVSGTVTVWGWAIDRNATGTTSGIDRVVLYRDGPPNVGTLIGTAAYGLARTDIGTYFGNARWTNSGWQYDWNVGNLTAGAHTLYAEMRSSITGTTKVMTQNVTVAVTGAATPPPPPPPGSVGGVAAPAQPPAAYAVPAGAVTVTTSAGLVSALAAGAPQNIVLASGIYDNGGAFQNGNGHHLYSATLGGAVLRAGLVMGGNFGPGGGSVQGVAFDVSDSSKTLLDSIIHVWGPGGRGTRILDTTFNGNNVVGSSILARQPEGLVVQRVRVRNFRVNGITVDANVQNMVMVTPVLLEDLDVANVSFAVPKSSNGTAEACVWLGNTGTVRRALIRNCAWQGLWTGTADAGSTHEDLDIDGTPTGVYVEHFTTGSTFQRMSIGTGVSTGVNCEWADPTWGSRPACVDNVIQDSTIRSSYAGVFLDQGTTRTTVRRVTFIGQTKAAIVDYLGINNAYSGNDYSGIAPGAVSVSFTH